MQNARVVPRKHEIPKLCGIPLYYVPEPLQSATLARLQSWVQTGKGNTKEVYRTGRSILDGYDIAILKQFESWWYIQQKNDTDVFKRFRRGEFND